MSAVDGIDEFAAQLAGILKEKNAAYGDSFARVPTILAMLYPSVPPEVLENILFTARILDKLGRIAQDPLGAGEDAYLDTAGYAVMGANGQRLKRAAKQREAAGTLAGAATGAEAKEAFEPYDNAPKVEARELSEFEEIVAMRKEREAEAPKARAYAGLWFICWNVRSFNCDDNEWRAWRCNATAFENEEEAEAFIAARAGIPPEEWDKR